MGTMDLGRRQVLQGGLAAGGLLLSGMAGRAWAQSPGGLLSVPKVALVVGNSKYRQVPLRNPTNDAGAMAEVLNAAGFQVTLKLDAPRAEMVSAIQSHAQALAAKKGVGLFYFAGHGVQLAWRNYLIPVDAVVEKTEDIQTRGVDLGSLLKGITEAGNPMNVIILDACRDDPFGDARRLEQKGLSQVDAPPGTLLAYATSPGNTAADGEGANGLYTEHLLRESKTQGAKIEDVFKRVRLGVRRKSSGRQIPWESTSLEEDFFFVPPPQLKKLSDEEKEKRYKEETALWERVETARDPAPLEDYLRRYPSGNFAELAQLQLDRSLAAQGEKKIQIALAEGNPYTKGSAVANTDRKVGDSYTYRVLDLSSKKERTTFTSTITRITDTEVTYGDGRVTDLLGNVRRTVDGARFSANQEVPLEYAVGKRWVTRYSSTPPRGTTGSVEMHFQVVTRESITVPAGTFNAFRVEGQGVAWGQRGGFRIVQIRRTDWFAPDRVRGAVAWERDRRAGPDVLTSDRAELVSYKES
ncbi:MAG: caspase family protein [Candidatus Rokubacteria bacterium]|nr:caspase family protein [Candidatus Rokubacteria bacterium]